MKTLTATARVNLLRRQQSLLALRALRPPGSGQGSATSPDHVDLGTQRSLDELLRTVDERERRELLEIDAALRRIDEGTWGRCESCDGPIGRQRLLALPEARRCLGCRVVGGADVR